MKTIIYVSLTSLYVFGSCQQNKPVSIEFNVVKEVNKLAPVVETRDLNKIRKVCTDQGLKSLLDWTDSLKKDKVMIVITEKLSQNVLEYVKTGNRYRIMIGENEMKDGDNVGEIVLVVQNERLLIDQYLGGTVIH